MPEVGFEPTPPGGDRGRGGSEAGTGRPDISSYVTSAPHASEEHYMTLYDLNLYPL